MRMKILKMVKNLSLRKIVKELGISRKNISETLSKFQRTVSGLNQTGYGCSWKLQHRMVRQLIRTAKAQPKKIAEQMMSQ